MIHQGMIKMKRLNIFVDETGEFGFNGDGASRLYGISFVFHEQDNDISNEINNLNNRLDKIGYTNMIHTSALIMKKGEYYNYNIDKRKNIFNSIYTFAKRVNTKYYTIIIDKKYTDNYKILKKKLTTEVQTMINNYEAFFKNFDKIILYYDNGQEPIGKILDSLFNFTTYNHIITFNHTEKRLFQVADMLTFIAKYDYKNKHKIQLTKAEKYFFKDKEMGIIIKELRRKKL